MDENLYQTLNLKNQRLRWHKKVGPEDFDADTEQGLRFVDNLRGFERKPSNNNYSFHHVPFYSFL